MAGFKNGKIMLPIKEFLIVKEQATYELNTIDMSKVTIFYRKYNKQAFLETYQVMPKGDYRINEVGGNKQLQITNLDILNEYYSIQLCRVVDLTSSPYNPSGEIDPITLNQHFNELASDVTFLFGYLKDVGMVMDSSAGNKILAELKPLTTWYMDENGNMAAMPVNSLFDGFNQLIESLRKEISVLLQQDYQKLSNLLTEETKVHIQSLKDELDNLIIQSQQELDKYTQQKIEEIKNACEQLLTLKYKLFKADTIEQLKTMTFLQVGEVVEVLGYYQAGDGAGHKRIISPDDDGSGVQLANGLWANIVHNGEVNVSWFGIKDNENDNDTEIFKKILKYSKNILIDNITNVDKVVLPQGTKLKGKKILAVQIQLNRQCSMTDIELFPKETSEDIPFWYINANGFNNTKAEINISNIHIPGREINRENRDFCVVETSENQGVWDIDINNIHSEQRVNFRTMFKFKAHKLRTSTSKQPWITYTRVRNISIIGGINMVELLTYYDEDGEYGYIQEQKGAVIDISLENCHFESNGKAKTMLRLGNRASVKMTNAFTGDFNQYPAGQKENYIIIDNRNRKELYGCSLYCPLDDADIYETRYDHISFIDKNNLINLFDYGSSIVSKSTNQSLPSRDVFDILGRFYELQYNSNIDVEKYFVIAKFPEKAVKQFINLCYILANMNDANLRFFSINLRDSVDSRGVKFYSNIETLKTLMFYKKGSYYYLVLKQTASNKLNLITNMMMISRKRYSYFWVGKSEEFNQLGLELIYECNVEPNVRQLDTPHYSRLMQKEGCLEEFDTYLTEKNTYDKAQRKLEEDKQLAYQEELKSNPNLTYEEFLSTYSLSDRMMLPEFEEPQIPQSVQNFIDKYINGENVSVTNTDLQKVQNNLRGIEKLNNYIDCEDMKAKGVYEDYKKYREELKTYIERSNQGLSLLIEIPQPSEKLLAYINRRKEEGTL